MQIPAGNKVVGIVGRLVEQKGIDDFIEIAARIQERQKDCSFIVVGDGPLRVELEKMAQERKVPIKFTGDRQDLPELLPVFDIFIFTSRWEPFGIIILESLASGVPVVGFAVDGMRAIIEKGGGGILVQNRDHAKVAEAACSLLNDQRRRDEVARQGYENVQKNFEVKENIKALEEEYQGILNAR